ncbi:hypothetical protein Taro_022764 [Colocasia esculenta]|uniref:RRM domain-containing protein n=1 Tax=Colocasia esculenta TaxID=4460 RepID=A0A843V4L8_COLES|nr:hypothetical protein [Colocasia esculenta]
MAPHPAGLERHTSHGKTAFFNIGIAIDPSEPQPAPSQALPVAIPPSSTNLHLPPDPSSPPLLFLTLGTMDDPDSIPVDALLLFHSQERILFRRLVELGMEPISAMGILAFWMWLESVGHPSLTGDLVAMPGDKLMRIAAEGEPCVASVLLDPSSPVAIDARRRVSAASAVPGSPIDLGYLHTFWSLAREGLISILNDTCPYVFGDLLSDALKERADDQVGGSSRSVSTNDVREESVRMRAIGYSRVQNVSSGILGPYSDARARRGSTSDVWKPLIRTPNVEEAASTLAFMPPRKDTSSVIIPYGEGTSGVPHRSLHLGPRMEGSKVTGGYRGIFLPEGWDLYSRNILNMQQQIQKNNLQMMLGQSFRVPFCSSNGEMGMGRLSPPAGNMNYQGVGNALVPSNSMRIPARYSSSYAFMHQRLSKLNTKAQLWPEPYIPPDERTLFITFSNGYPLGARDLYDFFSRRYGGVEDIYIQETEGDDVPLYARAVFYLQSICLRVLAGNEKAKFMIKGRHVWARRYIPKRKRKGVYKEMRWCRPMRGE